MSAFDKVIGYESIKNELLQICDMIHHREVYEKLGAKLPQGILLSGEPGLGKTLMAKCFIEESGLPSYVVRRNKGNDDFVGEITETFRKAKENAPAVVFLDDMDKFANEDDWHRDAPEYVAVQAGIDEVKCCNVFVIATVNEARKLPDSLTRAGRFDRKISVQRPGHEDSRKIIEYYLSGKKISDNVNMDDLSKMISYSSCADLESILNDAALSAAFARKESIEMNDLVSSVLRKEYDSPDNFTEVSEDSRKRVAIHEAGHLVICETLRKGSIGLASIRTKGRSRTGGFVHLCEELKGPEATILIALAGKAAEEMYYADHVAGGCHADMEKAYDIIRGLVSKSGSAGLGMLDVETNFSCRMSDPMNIRTEAVVHAELERYMRKVRGILMKKRQLLERVADELVKKETLLYSDIRKLEEENDAANTAA